MSRSPSFRFYASDFLGSPSVQLMDAAETGAYVLLLCVAWEGDRHGYLPDDEDKMRRWAKLDREQWAISRETILSKFPVIEEGWRANPRMVIEAEKAKAFSDKQSANGKKGGRPEKNPSLSENNPSLSPENPTPPKVKAKQKLPLPLPLPLPSLKPSRDKRERETHPNFASMKEAIFHGYRRLNDGNDPPWDGAEGKQLSKLLKASPNTPLAWWLGCINNRFASEAPHGDRPCLWLPFLSSYAGGPKDRFKSEIKTGVTRPINAIDKMRRVS